MKFRFIGGIDVPEWILAEVSVLSKISCVRLKLITRQVINELAGGVLDIDKVTKLIPSSSGFQWSDIKAALAAIQYIILNAARYDINPNLLNTELQQLGLPKENSDGISRPFKIHKDRLVTQAKAYSLRYPRLFSLEWRSDQILSSSVIEIPVVNPSNSKSSQYCNTEPIINLRLSLSHSSTSIPPKFSAPSLGATSLLLSSRRVITIQNMDKSGELVAGSDFDVVSAERAMIALGASSITDSHTESKVLSEDIGSSLRPAVQATNFITVSLSKLDIISLVRELRAARNIVHSISTASKAT